MKLKKLFISYCNNKELEINNRQVNIIESINRFYQKNFDNYFLLNLFLKKDDKKGFYLQGDVGVGKTMILNFFYENFSLSKKNFILINL